MTVRGRRGVGAGGGGEEPSGFDCRRRLFCFPLSLEDARESGTLICSALLVDPVRRPGTPASPPQKTFFLGLLYQVALHTTVASGPGTGYTKVLGSDGVCRKIVKSLPSQDLTVRRVFYPVPSKTWFRLFCPQMG